MDRRQRQEPACKTETQWAVAVGRGGGGRRPGQPLAAGTCPSPTALLAGRQERFLLGNLQAHNQPASSRQVPQAGAQPGARKPRPTPAGMCSVPVPQAPLRRVAVTGGTHGNELSGVYLARHWLRDPRELRRPSFSATPVLANPAAAAACRRYVDRDLNRTFTDTLLVSRATPNDPHELTRARELDQLLGPKASGSDRAFDFVLDLHNTTANMGTCLLVDGAHNTFALHLSRHLQLQFPEVPCQVLLTRPPQSARESFSLDSVAKNGMTVELGPQPQGVLRADIFSRMRALVASALDFMELFNQGAAFPAFEMEVYRNLGGEDFPRTQDGDLAGMVHPQLQVRGQGL
ncbi:N-acyl-aromatic-L-amino acid amidohydrolase (carboxylate-forming) isoform X6 [Marmota marmota marmota]|uniref:N-acyl-aromatic-L-amino acid amidohydrolase (carboxylate-forming) isoform X6 n=1 Tax=Marmota marmota marmota TaxID=9994 RepID=UPI0007622C77|nr:N-acyl-aromatic-L-amino acid amidohydrolase (carboxylate-forming) isoform X6 [Marmota marmota marmota]